MDCRKINRLTAMLAAVLLVFLWAMPAGAETLFVHHYTQANYDAPEWALYGYSGRSLKTSGCVLFSYAHAIQWLTGKARGDDLLRELISVCSDPNGYYHHGACTHGNKGSSGGLIYRNYAASKYQITSVTIRNTLADLERVLSPGNGAVMLSGKSKGGRHATVAVDFARDAAGTAYVHVVDSNSISYHEGTPRLQYFTRSGDRFIPWESYENAGTDYWLKVSDINTNFVVGSVLIGKNSLHLDTLSKTLKPGKKYTITCQGESGKLTYSSDHPKIAEVNSKGVVTAKKAGECIITVTADNGRRTQVKITVKSVPIQMEETNIRMKAGEKYQLLPKQPGTTGAAFKYKSSDKSVAAVTKSGVIKAKARGTCTVTVTSGFGEQIKLQVRVK